MKVLSFKPAPDSYPGWWLLEVEGQKSPLLVGNNWVTANCQLQSGDEIALDATKYLHYSDTEYSFALNIKKIPKAAVVE